MSTRICAHCGKIFVKGTGPSPNSKFCSEACYQAHSKELSKKYRESNTRMITCKWCKKDFEAGTGATKYSTYCSIECSEAAEKERQARYVETKIKTCKFCGKPFQLKKDKNGNYHNNQVYCSVICNRLGTAPNVTKVDENTYKISGKYTYYVDIQTGEDFYYCEFCDKRFTIKRNEKGMLQPTLYCSTECSYKGYMRKFEQTKTRICAYCGKEFLVPRKTKGAQIGKFSETLFCSEKCQYAGRSKAQNEARKTGKRHV